MASSSILAVLVTLTLAYASCEDIVLAQDVHVTGRHALLPDPLNASLTAVAFDFNGVSFNVTVLPGLNGVDLTAPMPTAVTRILVALTTACNQCLNTSWSNISNQPHRFRFYATSPLSLNQWIAPSGSRLIDTNGSACDTIEWFEIFASVEMPLVPPFEFSMFHITEPDWNADNATLPNYVLFHEFLLFRSANVSGTTAESHRVGMQQPAGQRDPPRQRRRIEFIGDSITAGYCNTCNLFPNATNNYALQDFSYSWARLTCAAFSADCHTEAWSGRGLMQNCDATAPVWMPNIVRRAVGSVSENDTFWGVSNKWDLSLFAPDALVINLGTNDYACNPIPNMTVFNNNFEEAYIKMLTYLLDGYGNQTAVGIFLACGPMSTLYCDAVQNVIATMHSLGKPDVFFLNHTGLVPLSDQCCGHPDTVADVDIADFTVRTIQAALGWS
jgi:lysophospholipase L1-like esterase